MRGRLRIIDRECLEVLAALRQALLDEDLPFVKARPERFAVLWGIRESLTRESG